MQDNDKLVRDCLRNACTHINAPTHAHTRTRTRTLTHAHTRCMEKPQFCALAMHGELVTDETNTRFMEHTRFSWRRGEGREGRVIDTYDDDTLEAARSPSGEPYWSCVDTRGRMSRSCTVLRPPREEDAG